MPHQSFSPKARWDRNIPENSQQEIPEDLNEKIDCLVLFKSGKITPQRIFWNNKEYEIKTISYYWQERRGQELLHYFSVNTGSNLYQISFNNTSLRWQIDKIIE